MQKHHCGYLCDNATFWPSCHWCTHVTHTPHSDQKQPTGLCKTSSEAKMAENQHKISGRVQKYPIPKIWVLETGEKIVGIYSTVHLIRFLWFCEKFIQNQSCKQHSLKNCVGCTTPKTTHQYLSERINFTNCFALSHSITNTNLTHATHLYFPQLYHKYIREQRQREITAMEGQVRGCWVEIRWRVSHADHQTFTMYPGYFQWNSSCVRWHQPCWLSLHPKERRQNTHLK